MGGKADNARGTFPAGTVDGEAKGAAGGRVLQCACPAPQRIISYLMDRFPACVPEDFECEIANQLRLRTPDHPSGVGVGVGEGEVAVEAGIENNADLSAGFRLLRIGEACRLSGNTIKPRSSSLRSSARAAMSLSCPDALRQSHISARCIPKRQRLHCRLRASSPRSPRSPRPAALQRSSR